MRWRWRRMAGTAKSGSSARSDAASVRRLVGKLDRPNLRLRFCYEAGPTGYGLKRQIEALWHDCSVIAPSLIPRRPGERVKANRRVAVKLARLFRPGELTEFRTPDETHEAMRDLVRAREAAVKDRTRKRQEIRSFLLRNGRVYPRKKARGTKYFKWLHDLSFAWPAADCGPARDDHRRGAVARTGGAAGKNDQGRHARLISGTGGGPAPDEYMDMRFRPAHQSLFTNVPRAAPSPSCVLSP